MPYLSYTVSFFGVICTQYPKENLDLETKVSGHGDRRLGREKKGRISVSAVDVLDELGVAAGTRGMIFKVALSGRSAKSVMLMRALLNSGS